MQFANRSNTCAGYKVCEGREGKVCRIESGLVCNRFHHKNERVHVSANLIRIFSCPNCGNPSMKSKAPGPGQKWATGRRTFLRADDVISSESDKRKH